MRSAEQALEKEVLGEWNEFEFAVSKSRTGQVCFPSQVFRYMSTINPEITSETEPISRIALDRGTDAVHPDGITLENVKRRIVN
jgi:hypothetical protein